MLIWHVRQEEKWIYEFELYLFIINDRKGENLNNEFVVDLI